MISFKNYVIAESLEFDKMGQRILDDGKKIADFEIDEMPDVTRDEVISYFVDDASNMKDPAVRYLKTLKLPKTFMYVWIQFIKILPQQRGQGRGSEIINTLAMQYPPGTLMALSAEEVSSGKTASSLADLKQFYRQNGFTMVRSQGKTFGFRVV
jgi:GNAT superfamily N-acetyltransferase